MGGKGSGGFRVGAGRKPKPSVEQATEVPPPDGMSELAVAVWVDLAPYAVAQRKLGPKTAAAFRGLVEALAEFSATLMGDAAAARNHEIKVRELIAKHGDMLQRAGVGLMQFGLVPVTTETAPA